VKNPTFIRVSLSDVRVIMVIMRVLAVELLCQAVEVVLRQFHRHSPRAARCGSLLEGLRSLGFKLWKKHAGLKDLCGLGCRSVTPYVHGERCVCVAMCCLKRLVSGSVAVRPLYSIGVDSYMEPQGPTGGPMVGQSLEPLFTRKLDGLRETN
jgi:hypothetical protein